MVKNFLLFLSLCGRNYGFRWYLLQRRQRALADDTVSVIACPVDYSENTKLTEKLEHLGQPSEISCRVDE